MSSSLSITGGTGNGTGGLNCAVRDDEIQNLAYDFSGLQETIYDQHYDPKTRRIVATARPIFGMDMGTREEEVEEKEEEELCLCAKHLW